MTNIQKNNTENPDSVINLNENIFQAAHKYSASDIHIEPQKHGYRIRLRHDGLLHLLQNLTLSQGRQLCNRIKVLAELNVTDHRFPQDGRWQFNLSNTIQYDIRVNITPTIYGEKLVLRLFSNQQNKLSIQQLGLLSCQLNILQQKIMTPYGLILISGPTGSGKTSTLYAIMQYLNSIACNIATIEDPVEMSFDGINQSNVQHHLALDFHTMLKSILRQDPDIIMIGEIRDHTTAKIAIQAAQTGHLVLSTLHANHSLDALFRLNNLGISRDLITQTLILSIAQRLARKCCSHCFNKKTTNPTIITESNSCHYCHHGYFGRMGIFELLMMQDEFKSIFLRKRNYFTLSDFSKPTLKDVMLTRIQEGLTDHEELIRILGDN